MTLKYLSEPRSPRSITSDNSLSPTTENSCHSVLFENINRIEQMIEFRSPNKNGKYTTYHQNFINKFQPFNGGKGIVCHNEHSFGLDSSLLNDDFFIKSDYSQTTFSDLLFYRQQNCIYLYKNNKDKLIDLTVSNYDMSHLTGAIGTRSSKWFIDGLMSFDEIPNIEYPNDFNVDIFINYLKTTTGSPSDAIFASHGDICLNIIDMKYYVCAYHPNYLSQWIEYDFNGLKGVFINGGNQAISGLINTPTDLIYDSTFGFINAYKPTELGHVNINSIIYLWIKEKWVHEDLFSPIVGIIYDHNGNEYNPEFLMLGVRPSNLTLAIYHYKKSSGFSITSIRDKSFSFELNFGRMGDKVLSYRNYSKNFTYGNDISWSNRDRISYYHHLNPEGSALIDTYLNTMDYDTGNTTTGFNLGFYFSPEYKTTIKNFNFGIEMNGY